MNWIKATPEDRWANGGVYWVTIRCTADGSRSVGLFPAGRRRALPLRVAATQATVVTMWSRTTARWKFSGRNRPGRERD